MQSLLLLLHPVVHRGLQGILHRLVNAVLGAVGPTATIRMTSDLLRLLLLLLLLWWMMRDLRTIFLLSVETIDDARGESRATTRQLSIVPLHHLFRSYRILQTIRSGTRIQCGNRHPIGLTRMPPQLNLQRLVKMSKLRGPFLPFLRFRESLG